MSTPTDAVAVSAQGRLRPRFRYLSLAAHAAQRTLAYRGSVILDACMSAVWALVLFSLWRALFAARGAMNGFSWDQMMTYLVLATGLQGLYSHTTEQRMIKPIRTGDVAVELTRPTDYLYSQFSQALGAALLELASALALAAVLVVSWGGIGPPATLAAGVLFVLSAGLGYVVKFLIGYLTGLICFYTLHASGLLWTRAAVTSLFSGSLVPLSFLPETFQAVARFAPFQSIVHVPASIYLGRLDGVELYRGLATQLFWILVLGWLAKRLWLPSMRRLVLQGG
jgi:ABC-2 type transport system permease protein